MTRKVCQKCFVEIIDDKNQGGFIEMLLTIEYPTEECDTRDCNEQATKVIYGKGESAQLGLPSRKQYILQMHKEVAAAIEIGCIIEFSAKERFLPGPHPQVTIYEFIVNKEMLVKNINDMEKGK